MTAPPTVKLIEQQRRTRETPGSMPTDGGHGGSADHKGAAGGVR